MSEITRAAGFIPLLLCQYATHVVPMIEEAGIDVDGYCLPINKEWSWFDRDACVEIIQSLKKPVIAFMPLASGGLRSNVPAALEWLYCDVGVESILFGTATGQHAAQTEQIARAVRNQADLTRTSSREIQEVHNANH